MDDWRLLREYAETGSEAAFTALMNRHLGLVYSAALRRLREPQAAEEVAQTVFSILARKARRFRPGTPLVGWLYRTTCFTAAKYWRTECRRRRREQEAFDMSREPAAEDASWDALAPHLDEAMNQIGHFDRLAILLRFFQGKPLLEVGQVLGVSEDAARMRVNRALEKLRVLLTRKEITCSSTVLGTLLLKNAVGTAPASAATVIEVAALAAAKAAGAPSLFTTLLALMAKANLKAATGAGMALLLGLTLGLYFYNNSQERSLLHAAESAPPSAAVSKTSLAAPRWVRPSRPFAAAPPTDPTVLEALGRLRKILYSPVPGTSSLSRDLRAVLDQLKPNSDATLDLLLEALEDGDVQEQLHYLPRSRAISGLGHLRETAQPALPALMDFIRTSRGPHRDFALWWALPAIRPQPELAQELMELYKVDAVYSSDDARGYQGSRIVLRDAAIEQGVRLAIAGLINARRDDASGIRALVVEYLSDPDADVRLLAASILTHPMAGNRVSEDEKASGLRELISALKETKSSPPGIILRRQEEVIRLLRSAGAAAKPAITDLREFIASTPNERLRKEATDTLSAFITAPDVTASGSKPGERQGDRGAALAKEVRAGSRSIADLIAALQKDSKTRVQATRALHSLGPKAVEALPALRELLKTDDEVFRDLVALTIKRIAPDEPKPLLTGDELVPALRAVSECLASADPDTREAIEREINQESRKRWFDHTQIAAIAEWLAKTDAQLREATGVIEGAGLRNAFVAELLKLDPKLATVLQRQP